MWYYSEEWCWTNRKFSNIFTQKLNCLDQLLPNFHEPWPPSKFDWWILNILSHLGYAISWQNYQSRPLLVAPRELLRGPQRGLKAPFEKPWSRQCMQSDALHLQHGEYVCFPAKLKTMHFFHEVFCVGANPFVNFFDIGSSNAICWFAHLTAQTFFTYIKMF